MAVSVLKLIRSSMMRIVSAKLLFVPLIVGFFTVVGSTSAVANPCTGFDLADRFSDGVLVTNQTLAHAKIIIDTGEALNLGEKGQVVALAAAIPTTHLRNFAGASANSPTGIFGQIPAAGWGTSEELVDPEFATKAFYEEMKRFQWRTLPVAEVARLVQGNERSTLYANAERDAVRMLKTFKPGTTCSLESTNLDAGMGLTNPEPVVSRPSKPVGEQVTIRTFRGTDLVVDKSIADNVRALLRDAHADGFNFYGFGWRSHLRQHELRLINDCPDGWIHTANENPFMFASPSRCRIPTARPGTSNHETGQAIDFRCKGRLIRSRSDVCYQWLARNASKYYLFNLPSEPWHWSVNGR